MTAAVDARPIVPRERHPLVLSTFDGLPAGAALELVNDHDPKPMFVRFMAERHGQFSRDVLEQGPESWRVRIGKTGRDCCGHCGG